jgi:hypothetical protein
VKADDLKKAYGEEYPATVIMDIEHLIELGAPPADFEEHVRQFRSIFARTIEIRVAIFYRSITHG